MVTFRWLRMVWLLAALCAGGACAQPFPSKPIRLLVGFSAGSVSDGVARLYGQKLSEMLGTPVIVDNRPSGGSLAAIRALLQSPADGHTVFLATGSALAQGPGLRKDLPYDPLKDFTFVGSLGISAGLVFAHPDVPVRSIPELIAYAKANPGKLTYSSAGIGSAGHIQGEYFMNITGTRMVHVPYKSDGDAAREVAAGTVNIGFTTARFALPLVSAGRLTPLAWNVARKLSALPAVPNITDVGVKSLEGLIPYTFYGLVGPAGMSAAVTTRLNEAINRISTMPDVATTMRESMLIEPDTPGPEEYRRFIEKELAKWRELGKSVTLTD